jgi:ankyrin repeat protein
MRRNTDLHVATRDDDWEAALSLIDRGAAVNIQNKDGDTALHKACQWEGQHGFRFVYIPGHTENFLKVVRSLIDNGASVNVQNKKGNTALHEACINCHYVASRLLVEAGADIMIQNKRKLTALHFACTGRYVSLDLVYFLLIHTIQYWI